MRRIQRIHLIGIGGSGMSGIAEVLFNLNYTVSGSDIIKSTTTERLKKLGIKITYSHIPENVANCDVVIVSSAIAKTNIELMTAQNLRIPIVPRAEMLSELMRFKQGIAVAGTHGKTTTTSLIASIFAAANLDPTFVIGGKLDILGANAQLGTGEYFVAEADESDASFMHLTPMMTVITNIDNDHLINYNNDFNVLKNTFIEFLHQLPFYGLAVICIDDQEAKSIIPKITRPVITYGFSQDADVKAIDFSQNKKEISFKTILPGQKEYLSIKLNLPGKHNALNALAAITIAAEIGIPFDVIQRGLESFQGVGRRFEVLGKFNLSFGQIMVVDDYGHHPREVKSVIESARLGWPNNRLVMVYQPHRYSRTKDLFEDFSSILSEVDILLMLDIYSAGEEPLPGADSRSLCSNIRKRGKVEPIFIESTTKLYPTLRRILKDGDIVLMQGAGDVSNIAKKIVKKFEKEVQEIYTI